MFCIAGLDTCKIVAVDYCILIHGVYCMCIVRQQVSQSNAFMTQCISDFELIIIMRLKASLYENSNV